jgi:transposase
MEPTGHYGKALAEYLVELGYTYVLVNPMHVKKARNLAIIVPAKMTVRTHIRWAN